MTINDILLARAKFQWHFGEDAEQIRLISEFAVEFFVSLLSARCDVDANTAREKLVAGEAMFFDTPLLLGDEGPGTVVFVSEKHTATLSELLAL